jgi:hypothetical protein
MFCCKICAYTSNRADNLIRHQKSNKHKNKEREAIDNEEQEIISDVNSEQFFCYMCRKKYKSQKRLKSHEKKCNGIDVLTCHTCMTSFTDSGNKCNHIKKKICKPVTIFKHLHNKGIISDKDNASIHSIVKNNINQYIRNYGNERIDYITNDIIIDVLKKAGNSLIVQYAKLRHFNPDFPENHNIRYENKRFVCKQNNVWEIISKDRLVNKLWNDNGNFIYTFINQDNNKNAIKAAFPDDMRYDELMKERGNYVYLESMSYDANIKQQLIDLIISANIGLYLY